MTLTKDLMGSLGDTTAGIIAFGALANALPPTAATLTIVWTGIRIYEWARVRLFNLDGQPDEK